MATSHLIYLRHKQELIALMTDLPDYPASVVLNLAPPCFKGNCYLQCSKQRTRATSR